MKRVFYLIIALLLFSLTACQQAAEQNTIAEGNEPGVVTVFKSPT